MANYIPLSDKKGYIELRDILKRNIEKWREKEKLSGKHYLDTELSELKEVEERIKELEEKENKKP